MTLPDFGLNSTDHMVDDFRESAATCNGDLRLVATMASLQVNSQTQNLLKNGGLTVRDFKPLPIRLVGTTILVPAVASNRKFHDRLYRIVILNN